MAETTTVAVLARAPSTGGKRRLFAALGVPADPELLRALLLDTLDGVLATGFHVLVGVAPVTAADEMRALVPRHVDVVPQVSGDLGDRMPALMGTALARGATAVLLVGSDLPDLSSEPLREAARVLRDEPGAVVLGPAEDGGYYMVGATRVPDIFGGIDWGTSEVLQQTETAMARAGLVGHRVATQRDVDLPADLGLVRGARTRAWVEQSRASGLRI
jgi:uncharacterized protein